MIRQITTLAAITTSTICVDGQGTQGSISAKISNENPQGIHAVTVEVKNESTGFTTTTVTNQKGEFYFKQLPLGGAYTIIAYSDELGEEVKNGYHLNLGDEIKVDFKFNSNLSDIIEIDAVEVSGNSLIITIKNIGSSTSVTAKDIERLPVNGRNFTSLIDLSPLSSGSNLSGQLASSTNFMIDGMTAKNPTPGGTTNRNGGPYAISMESAREFAVVTHAYDVTLGRSGGGTINTVTKSGTNTLSGSVFMFGRTDWLSSPYDIRANKRDSKFSKYQFGFTLGGPIIKDKLHYFFAWDHQAHSSPLIIADIQNEQNEAGII
ncbi:carboxypeptidase regulatory-like domain-containing protein [Vaginella massiliensis]|uniref:TonB-dependent receptor n=1 Tax=Vaginella massiliensis TaxID=1816680 RepID=UPI000A69C530|nr:carboxypeptidase-like regulatory domain-containing protein [Vaginella massiliensis]